MLNKKPLGENKGTSKSNRPENIDPNTSAIRALAKAFCLPQPTALLLSPKACTWVNGLPLKEAHGSKSWQTPWARGCKAGMVQLGWGKSAPPYVNKSNKP